MKISTTSTGSWGRGVAAALLLGFASMAAAACGDDEDTITVYSGREEELVAPLFERFEQQTGTEVEVRYGDTSELAATIIEEGDNSPADLFFSQDAGALGALQQEDLLAPLGTQAIEQVDRRFRSAEGEWVGVSGRARVVAYNRDAVPRSELPDSVLDFTDQKWSGRIGWAPTNGSFQAFVTALRLTEGEAAARSWLEGIVANDPESFEDNEAIRDAIAAGEIDVGFINHYYVAQAQEEEGADYPVAVFFPPGGDAGSLVNVAGAGVLESSGNPDAAEEFVEFLLSERSQRYFSDETKEYPLVQTVEADVALVPLGEIDQPDLDLSDLEDLRGTLRLLEETGAI